MKKRVLSILTALALCLSLLPTVALAEGGVSYLDAAGKTQTCTTATEVTSSDTEWTTGWYVVQGDVTIGTVTASSRIEVSGDVHLILADGCNFTVYGGIQVQDSDNNSAFPSPNSLTIYGQTTPLLDETGNVTNNVGKLIATGGCFDAGIGGSKNGGNGGAITINGGVVTATGDYGAGIGGGEGGAGNGGNGGTITINGGVVRAKGGDGSAGIGGGRGVAGNGGDGGTIIISGGTVTATGGDSGAGIGGGYGMSGGDGGTITITGGTVRADGGNGGAGIGGGRGGGMGNGGDGGTITISDGTVTADGGNGGAGIGGGGSGMNGGAGGTITINGGDVKAIGNDGGAGIGGGGSGSLNGSAGGTITINGGTVTAHGGESGVGIGGNGGGSITISGGTVTARGLLGSGGGTGIGGRFQTTNTGNAVIDTSSIADTSDQNNWSGIIFLKSGVSTGDPRPGTVYGKPTLTSELTIPGGYTLTIPAGASLTIPAKYALSIQLGTKLINNGTLYSDGNTVIKAGGTLTNYGAIYVGGDLNGTLTNNGALYYPLNLAGCKVDTTNTAEDAVSTVNGKTYGKVGETIYLAATPSENQLVTGWSGGEPSDKGNGRMISSMPANMVSVAAMFDTALNITQQPQGGTITYGESKTLSVAVSKHSSLNGHTWAYQWYLDSSPISGANGSSYTTPADLGVGKHTYTCKITYYVTPGVYTVTSGAATVTVNPLAETAPKISIDYQNETLTGFVSGSKYAIDGTAVTTDGGKLSVLDYIGHNISIVTKASDSNHADSTAQTLTIPARPEAPSSPVCTINYSNETISFDSSKYEVNTAADFAGTAVANNGTVTPGTTLYVRQKASGISFASEATPVPIPARPATPSISGSYAVSTTDPTKFIYTVNSSAQNAGAYEYRMDSGAWQPSASFDSIEPLSQHTFYARLKATVSAMAGAESSITVTFSELAGGGSVTMQGWTYGETAEAPVPGSDKNGTAHVTYSYEGINGTNYPSSTDIPTDAGEYQVTATFAATAVYQEATATATFTINPRPVTVSGISAQDKTYDGKSAAALDYSNAVISGVCSGDSLSVTATGTFSDPSAGEDKTVHISDLTLDGEDKANYVLANDGQQTAATASITARDITVSITPGGGCYGNITPATAELNDLVDGENPTVTLTYTGTANDGTFYNSADAPTRVGSYTVTASISDPNYNLTGTVTGTFAVTKAAQSAPDAPTVKSKTWNSVTLNDIEDSAQSGAKAQYSVDGGTTCQDSPEFTGLSANTEYSFVAWYAETDNYFASLASAALNVTTSAAPSSGGGSSSGGSSSTTTTEKNPDGSTTTTVTNKTTGTVTETTKNTDGSTTTVETKKDGTVTETNKTADGTTGTVVTDKYGDVTEVQSTVSSSAAKEVAKTGEAVTLPVEVPAAASTEDAPAVEVTVPKSAGSVKVEIPVEKVTPGTVAVIVNADGTEEIVSTSVVTENGVVLTLDGNATVKIIDNSKDFVDVPETNVFYNEISSLSAREIMIGKTEDTFDLYSSVTLNQIANVAGRITGAVDVKDFNAGIVWGGENGLKTGNVAATRGDVLKALYVAAGSPAVEDTAILARFSDSASIPTDMAAIVAWAAQNGILKGTVDGKADLGVNVTRGQACALAGRAMGVLA